MAQKEIREIISNFSKELKKNNIKYKKIFLFGSYARGDEKIDSDIDIAIICKKFAADSIEQNMKLWKIALKVDTRIAPVSLSPEEFKKDYLPIIPEIKKGLDLTSEAA